MSPRKVSYSDTGVEIPTLHSQSLMFLRYLKRYGEIIIVKPALEKSFWSLIVGKGYPAPHQKFRWCTDKLKIQPTAAYVEDKKKLGKVAIFTGVRFGESDVRDTRMYAACSRGGECGQGIWMDESKNLGVGYFAPIAFWRQCDVWDYVNFSAVTSDYPTDKLETIYNGRDSRFGCWTCTVVSQDKTMKKITSTKEGEHLGPLLSFRNWLAEYVKQEENRVIRPNNQKGRLNLKAREEILKEIDKLEKLGFDVISAEEREFISDCWNSGKYGDSYERA